MSRHVYAAPGFDVIYSEKQLDKKEKAKDQVKSARKNISKLPQKITYQARRIYIKGNQTSKKIKNISCENY